MSRLCSDPCAAKLKASHHGISNANNHRRQRRFYRISRRELVNEYLGTVL